LFTTAVPSFISVTLTYFEVRGHCHVDFQDLIQQEEVPLGTTALSHRRHVSSLLLHHVIVMYVFFVFQILHLETLYAE
jgi:hypothetical protein